MMGCCANFPERIQLFFHSFYSFHCAPAGCSARSYITSIIVSSLGELSSSCSPNPPEQARGYGPILRKCNGGAREQRCVDVRRMKNARSGRHRNSVFCKFCYEIIYAYRARDGGVPHDRFLRTVRECHSFSVPMRWKVGTYYLRERVSNFVVNISCLRPVLGGWFQLATAAFCVPGAHVTHSLTHSSNRRMCERSNVWYGCWNSENFHPFKLNCTIVQGGIKEVPSITSRNN